MRTWWSCLKLARNAAWLNLLFFSLLTVMYCRRFLNKDTNTDVKVHCTSLNRDASFFLKNTTASASLEFSRATVRRVPPANATKWECHSLLARETHAQEIERTKCDTHQVLENSKTKAIRKTRHDRIGHSQHRECRIWDRPGNWARRVGVELP